MTDTLLADRERLQAVVDRRAKEARYTGIAYDLVCRQHAIWVRGELVTWADTRTEANRILAEEVARRSRAY